MIRRSFHYHDMAEDTVEPSYTREEIAPIKAPPLCVVGDRDLVILVHEGAGSDFKTTVFILGVV